MGVYREMTTRVCDRCKAPKPIKGGLQLAKMLGQRRAQLFCCWDCVQLHVNKTTAANAERDKSLATHP